MKNFIEVEDTQEKKACINVNYIFSVLPQPKGSQINMIPKGHNNYPYIVYHVVESYEEVMKLISAAQ